MENLNNKYIYKNNQEIEAMQYTETNEIEVLGFSQYAVYVNKYGFLILESTGETLKHSNWLCRFGEKDYCILTDSSFNKLYGKENKEEII